MISTTILVFGIIIALFLGIRDFVQHKKNTSIGKKTFFPLKSIITLLVFIIIAFIQPFTAERIDQGYVGIKVNLTGAERGMDEYQYETGWVIYNTWITQVLEYPTFQQHIEYEEQNVITKGGFSATIKPTFNYKLKGDAVGDMFLALRLPIAQIEQGWLKTAIVGSVNDVANKWEVDAIFNDREKFEGAIVEECNKRVSKWFEVSQLRTNIIPPPSLQEAIEAKTKAIQQAQAEEQKALTAEAEAKKKIAIAKGDSAQLVINASSKAKAMELEQQKLTPLYIRYLEVQKWNGVMPTTVLSENQGIMISR